MPLVYPNAAVIAAGGATANFRDAAGQQSLAVGTTPFEATADRAQVLAEMQFAGAPLIRAATPYVERVRDISPALYWPLNDATFGIRDHSPAPLYNGTATGTPTVPTIGGNAGGAVANDSLSTDLVPGTNQRVTSAYTAFAAGATRTVSLWLNLDTQRNYNILWTGSAGAVAFFTDVNGTAYMRVGGDVTWANALAGRQGTWTHVATIFDDPNNTTSLYVGGSLVSTQAHGTALPGGNFNLGDVLYGFGLDAKVAHAAVFERALTSHEIKRLADAI